MPRLSLREILDATGGGIVSGSANVVEVSATGYAFDTRHLEPGDLFFALKGERRDGHEFVKDASARGAVAAVVATRVTGVPDGFVQIVVPSPLEALQALAAYVRSGLEIPVVAISGSNGKTTTKDMLSAILARRMRVHKSPGNFNNQIGAPLSVLGLQEDHEVLVIELGSNHRGEIKGLCEITRPGIGLITNVGKAHIGCFGSVAEIAREKTDIVRCLEPGGKGVVNADDIEVLSALEGVKVDLVRFGIRETVEFQATDIEPIAGGGISFRVGAVPVSLKGPGIHNVYNAIAAIAASSQFDVSPAEAAEALASLEPVRMKISTHAGLTVIDDSYNANPDSVRAALGVVARYRDSRKVFVLGEMLELGEEAEVLHRQVGSEAASSGIDILIGVGDGAQAAVAEARASGMQEDSAVFFEDKLQAREYLRKVLRSGDVVLVKGSRMVGLEEISDFLRHQFVEGRI
jgi:UDP-N-acetylmuramoyl-tripeptide--D-alanyl-D-alanine ligase